MTYQKNTFQGVLHGCKKMNRQDQHTLFKIYYSFASRISAQFYEEEKEIRQAVNEGFLEVFNSISEFDHSISFEAWFGRIIYQSCLDRSTQESALPERTNHQFLWQMKKLTTTVVKRTSLMGKLRA